MQKLTLRERFALWWIAVQAQGDSDLVYDQLERYYEAKNRFYHTLSYHIAGALELFTEYKQQLEDPLLIEGALFFHDVFPSEEESAHFAAQIMQHAGVHKDFCEQLAHAILVTDHHHTPTSIDEQYLCDIDLSFLALPKKDFITNTAHLRKEFPEKTDQEFRMQVIKFFAPLLARKNLFHTETFSVLEDAAKKNMLEYILEQ